MRLILLFMCYLVSSPSLAWLTNYTTDKFSQIAVLYHESQANPQTTLMVFDIDDTLLTMTQPLGSVGWWDWQRKLLKVDINSKLLFTKRTKKLIHIQNILYQLIKMVTTDKNILPFLNDSGSQGVTLIGLTSRGEEHLSATMMQLQDNKFISDKQILFKKHELQIDTATNSAISTIKCPKLKESVIYYQGIAFINGQDKGQALLCLLAHTKQKIETILVVDDSLKNILSVDTAFSKQNKYQLLNIWFTKELPKQIDVRTNPVLQKQIFAQWTYLKKALNKVIVRSNF